MFVLITVIHYYTYMVPVANPGGGGPGAWPPPPLEMLKV